MAIKSSNSFPPEVIRKLRTYVYRLIDPRSGETFYIGKGKGNRVFSHVRGTIALDGNDGTNTISRIREIQFAGLEVGHVIHRHGMDDKTAIEVEAALIDAYSGLTNVLSGAHSSEFGVMHTVEIIRRYLPVEAKFRHRVLLICVNRTGLALPLYDATRFSWKISKARAMRAEVILPTMDGLIVGAFVAFEWLDATAANFPELSGGNDRPGRIGFVGEEAPEEIKRQYIGKRIPDELRKYGSAIPVRYTW